MLQSYHLVNNSIITYSQTKNFFNGYYNQMCNMVKKDRSQVKRGAMKLIIMLDPLKKSQKMPSHRLVINWYFWNFFFKNQNFLKNLALLVYLYSVYFSFRKKITVSRERFWDFDVTYIKCIHCVHWILGVSCCLKQRKSFMIHSKHDFHLISLHCAVVPRSVHVNLNASNN